MRKPSWVKKSGPYTCVSLSNGSIVVKPSWPQYGHVWNEKDGGGPGLSGRMGLAGDLEAWLNSVYTEEEIATGKARIMEHNVNLELAGRGSEKKL